MTQLEVEELFDTTDKRTKIDELLALAGCKVKTQHREELATALSITDFDLVDAIIIDVLMIVGNPTNGRMIRKHIGSNIEYPPSAENVPYTGVRAESFQSFLRSLLGMPSLIRVVPEHQKRYEMCLVIVGILDGIVFSVNLEAKVQMIELGFKTHERVYLGFELSKEVIAKGAFEFYPMPLIETPKKWTTSQSGGYFLKNASPVKNKGYRKQPQAVLDVLNTLQSMAWTTEEQSSVDEEYKLQYAKKVKLIESNDTLARIRSAKQLTDDVTMSLATTRSFMEQQDHFYFEWQYDFRGRIYPSAYDLNPQGDSYKKGAIHGAKRTLKC